MIRKLRRKLTVLVLGTLFVIIAGIIAVLNYINWVEIQNQIDTSLQTLVQSGGYRPGQLTGTDDAQGAPEDGSPDAPDGSKEPRGQQEMEAVLRANLSNFYTVELDAQGTIITWFSDREELYSEEQVSAMVEAAKQAGTERGNVGTSYYRMEQRQYGSLLVVLDASIEITGAQRLLLSSALIALAAYILLSVGAIFLIRRMTQPVQEAFDKQKQFVMDASHELKTPLSVISANAEVLSGEIGENRWLAYIQSEVQRTDTLVSSLLMMARLDREAMQVRRQRMDLSRAVLSVALPFESAVFEAGKKMTMDIDDALSYEGDEEMIKQLVAILLSNAVKYSDAGGTIDLRLQVKGDKRVLSVRNTGGGIAGEELPHIFDRFYRADSARCRQNEGYGLGLSIAKQITDVHKGKIAVQSQEGQWACFTVTL